MFFGSKEKDTKKVREDFQNFHSNDASLRARVQWEVEENSRSYCSCPTPSNQQVESIDTNQRARDSWKKLCGKRSDLKIKWYLIRHHWTLWCFTFCFFGIVICRACHAVRIITLAQLPRPHQVFILAGITASRTVFLIVHTERRIFCFCKVCLSAPSTTLIQAKEMLRSWATINWSAHSSEFCLSFAA